MEMQEPHLFSQIQQPNMIPKPPKKKSLLNKVISPKLKKPSKKGLKADALMSQDSSISSSEYGALRHKYLMLEEESLNLDREISESEREVQALEHEKFALLDELVVLEGLVDAAEVKTLSPIVKKIYL